VAVQRAGHQALIVSLTTDDGGAVSFSCADSTSVSCRGGVTPHASTARAWCGSSQYTLITGLCCCGAVSAMTVVLDTLGCFNSEATARPEQSVRYVAAAPGLLWCITLRSPVGEVHTMVRSITSSAKTRFSRASIGSGRASLSRSWPGRPGLPISGANAAAAATT
jgi:hypothetical protein